ncbi:MAG: hypothetical protein IJS14_03085 [Lentisphaeria bacterium]|nr:hypothetical protein [Lentisphaeria bacterium]
MALLDNGPNGRETHPGPEHGLPIARPESFAGVHTERTARFRKMERLESGEVIEEQLTSGSRTENYLIRTPDGALQELKVMAEHPADPAAGPGLARGVEKLPDLTGLLPVIRCGTFSDGACFCVTEYRDVPTYQKMISMLSPLPPVRALALIYMPAVILARCRQNGLFHGWLTPSDILYEPQTGNSLSGMGLAQWRDRFFPQLRTRPGQWYSAPEAAAGKSVWQSDQYALGIMLFQMLTGVLPFYAEDAGKLAEMHLHATMPLPQERNPQVRLPAAVNAVLVRMTMKVPEDRYKSWESLLADLERANAALKKKETTVS